MNAEYNLNYLLGMKLKTDFKFYFYYYTSRGEIIVLEENCLVEQIEYNTLPSSGLVSNIRFKSIDSEKTFHYSDLNKLVIYGLGGDGVQYVMITDRDTEEWHEYFKKLIKEQLAFELDSFKRKRKDLNKSISRIKKCIQSLEEEEEKETR